ncbi:MAG: ATP-binding protein, partial [Flavobacterium sp.]|nr:ATP-binding protein [Flavobacterium sp.]
MSRIRIKNFGPIKDGFQENGGWIDIDKITIFIGNQGSGKSTIAKLISTFTWIEKALVRGDYDSKWFSRKNKLKNQFLNYHRLENYLVKKNGKTISEIEYQGEAYQITFKDDVLNTQEIKNTQYSLPQIMYVPAERNFISYVKSLKELKLSSDSLKEFLTEFDNAKDSIKGSISLPINNVDLEYDKLNDILNIKGTDYKVRLTESSSGFQSLVPLYIVSQYLASGVKKRTESNLDSMTSEELERFKESISEIYSNNSLTGEQRRAAVSALSSKFNKTCFINIVEEPEQNLFPISQKDMLNSLLEFNNYNKENKLIITTHSPYLLNHLSIAIKAGNLLEKKNINKEEISKIIPVRSAILNQS